MIFQEIECFITVADFKCISRAAESLYMSQSSCSKIITSLETKLGVKLFIRTKTGVSLSPEGSTFYSLCQDFLRGCSGLHSPESERGSLRIAFGNHIDGVNIPSILSLFEDRYPNIKISTFLSNNNDIFQSLLSQKIDIALMPTSVIPVTGFRHRLIQPYKLQVALWKEHPLSKKKTVTFEDIQQEKFITLKQNGEYEDIMSQIFSNAGFSPYIVTKVDSYQLLSIMILQKKGISIFLNTNDFPDLDEIYYVDIDINSYSTFAKKLGMSLVWCESNNNPAIYFLLQITESYLYDNKRGEIAACYFQK